MSSIDDFLTQHAEAAAARARHEADLEAQPDPDPEIAAVIDEFLARVPPHTAEPLYEMRFTKTPYQPRSRLLRRPLKARDSLQQEFWNTFLATTEREVVVVGHGWAVMESRPYIARHGEAQHQVRGAQASLVVDAEGCLRLATRRGGYDPYGKPAGTWPLYDPAPLRGRNLRQAIYSALRLAQSDLVGSVLVTRVLSGEERRGWQGDPNKLMPVTMMKACAEALVRYGAPPAGEPDSLTP